MNITRQERDAIIREWQHIQALKRDLDAALRKVQALPGWAQLLRAERQAVIEADRELGEMRGD